MSSICNKDNNKKVLAAKRSLLIHQSLFSTNSGLEEEKELSSTREY
jgi:hypothetical protein